MPAPLVARTPVDVDRIAAWLAAQAQYVHAMPPSWDAGKDMLHIAAGSDMALRLARGLPGKGLVLDGSLRDLGITKPIPHVFDRSLVERAIDLTRGHERVAIAAVAALCALKSGVSELPILVAGAIGSYNDILASRAAGKVEELVLPKTGASIPYANPQWSHYFSATGWQGAFAFTAALGASAPNNSTNGSLLFGFTNPTGGDKAYLLGIGFLPNSMNVWNTYQLTDVLYECGGISATTTSPQTLGTAALTRYTTGLGVQATLTPITAFSATATTATITYTNSAGTGSRSGTIAHVNLFGFGSVDRLIPAGRPYMTMQSGDVGIQSVSSLSFSVALAAGVGGLFLHKPLALFPGVAADIYAERDMANSLDGLMELVTTAGGDMGCPMLMGIPQSAGTISLSLFVKVARG